MSQHLVSDRLLNRLTALALKLKHDGIAFDDHVALQQSRRPARAAFLRRELGGASMKALKHLAAILIERP